MKKVITLALALLLISSLSATAFAATTTLTTTVPEATYTLNIPASQEIPFGTTETSIGNVTVTDSNGFADGKNLQVTISYSPFTATELSTKIPYTLALHAKGGLGYNQNYSANAKTEEIGTGAAIIFEGEDSGNVKEYTYIESTLQIDGSGSGSVQIPVSSILFKANSTDWGKALAGEYTTTITFTAEVVVETE